MRYKWEVGGRIFVYLHSKFSLWLNIYSAEILPIQTNNYCGIIRVVKYNIRN